MLAEAGRTDTRRAVQGRVRVRLVGAPDLRQSAALVQRFAPAPGELQSRGLVHFSAGAA